MIGRIVEIAEHGLLGGGLHRLGVVRALPVPVFGRMAFRAALRADVTAVRRDRRMAGRQRHGQRFHRLGGGMRSGRK